MNNGCPRIMFAAPASGAGKTTVVTGFLRALLTRGLKPAAFKCGPDYIDPMFHREVLGVPGRNLDLFFTPPAIVCGLFRNGAADADLSVLEGVMGYYDGVGATAEAGSWHLARETKTPAVLVLRPRGAFLSLAALVRGFLCFRDDCMLRGILLNGCGDALRDKLRPLLERETGLRVYGSLPDMPESSLASRHLGLATPDTVADLNGKIRAIAEQMEKSVDVAGLIELARGAPELPGSLPDIAPVAAAPVRIAVARDEAFCFYYEENLELLRACGADLVFFSPLRDAALPAGTAGLYLGGGYPELYAEQLAANAALRRDIGRVVAGGLPTLAECGGFLYLQSTLEDADGGAHAMVGLLDGRGEKTSGLKRFGYVRLRARRDSLLCDGGEEMPAHEFHRWDSDNVGDAFLAEKASGEGAWPCVVATKTLHAGFPHLYFWSNPETAARFVRAAARAGGS